MTDRAVSEVLGFILVFSLIVTMTSLVYVSGISELENRRDVERVDNAERAFDVLADNIDDIYRRDAPSRATEIRLADSQLRFGDTTTMTVDITNLPTPSDNTAIEPIIYSTGTGTELVYEGGAIIRTEPNGGVVMKEEPGMLFTENGGVRTAVIPHIQTRSESEEGIGGSTTALVRTDLASSEVLTARTDPDADGTTDANGDSDSDEYELRFTVETTSDRGPVWQAHLNDEIRSAYSIATDVCSESDGTVVCTFDVDRLHITATRIDVTFN